MDFQGYLHADHHACLCLCGFFFPFFPPQRRLKKASVSRQPGPASGQEESPIILAKSIKRPWGHDVAEGNKFLESNANTTGFQNQFGKLRTVDLFVIIEGAYKCKVAAVGRVQGSAHSQVKDRHALYSKLLPERRAALDEYLGHSESFN